MKGIAWSYLSPIQQSQLLYTRPDIFHGLQHCPRCLNGQILNGVCLQCSCEVDEDGQEIRGKVPDRTSYGTHQKVYL